jgi:hypothetical protein
MGMQPLTTGNKLRLHDLIPHQFIDLDCKAELVMNDPFTDSCEGIDRKTSRSICTAVGERLQQSLRPDTSRLSSHLQHLLDELQRRDDEGRNRSN